MYIYYIIYSLNANYKYLLMIKRKYTKDGWKYSYKGESISLTHLSVTKENAFLTNEDNKNLIKMESAFRNEISRYNDKLEFLHEYNEIEKPIKNYNGPFYKFVPSHVYENYLKKGKFQLGSSQYYRAIEKEESRDAIEGYCNLTIISKNREISTSVISGYNHYMLCGTTNLEQVEYMTKRFGGFVMEVRNLNSFARKVKTCIGAEKWDIQDIRYDDYNLLKIEKEIKDINGFGAELSEEAFSLIKDYSLYQSLFVKPRCFKSENEVRIAFKVKRVVKDIMSFQNIGLLNEVRFIKLG